jgi:hypothetical protein
MAESSQFFTEDRQDPEDRSKLSLRNVSLSTFRVQNLGFYSESGASEFLRKVDTFVSDVPYQMAVHAMYRLSFGNISWEI